MARSSLELSAMATVRVDYLKKPKQTITIINFTSCLSLKGPTDIKSTLEYLMTLFPRKLFNDSLPQIVLKHQLYSIHSDKTLVDKEVVRRLFMCQKTNLLV